MHQLQTQIPTHGYIWVPDHSAAVGHIFGLILNHSLETMYKEDECNIE